jgi:hypothetical protein
MTLKSRQEIIKSNLEIIHDYYDIIHDEPKTPNKFLKKSREQKIQTLKHIVNSYKKMKKIKSLKRRKQ